MDTVVVEQFQEGFTYSANSACDTFISPVAESALTRTQIELRRTSHGVIIQAEGPTPSWLPDTIAALKRVIRLPHGWDSYGASRVDFECVVGALEILILVMRDDSPTPSIVPTNDGKIQLEWHLRSIDLEIEVLSRQHSRVFIEDADGEREIDVGADLTFLVESIDRVSA